MKYSSADDYDDSQDIITASPSSCLPYIASSFFRMHGVASRPVTSCAGSSEFGHERTRYSDALHSVVSSFK